jgi:hypothetical protein
MTDHKPPYIALGPRSPLAAPSIPAATPRRDVPPLIGPAGLEEESAPQLVEEAEGERVASEGVAAPASPSSASSAWKKHPKGPHDVRAAVPWDQHSYPAPPSIPSPGRFEEMRRRSWLFLQRRAWPWLKKAAWNAAERAFWAWLEDYLNGSPDSPSSPRLPPGSPSLPALPPGRTLPALPPGEPVGGALSMGEPAAAAPGAVALPDTELLAAILRDPVAAGAYTTEPLALLNKWLKLAGIRYFSAEELTRQKWKGAGHTYKGEARGFAGRVVKGVACWAELLDALPPALGQRRGLMVVLPEYVVPAVEVWPRILPALMVLDRYRHVHGKPVASISGFRCAAYNWQIGGAKDSRHMEFKAVDFYPTRSDITIQGKGKFLDYRGFRDFFAHMYRESKDGLGIYDAFIHLDVGTRGIAKSKNWDNRSYKWG